MLRALFGVSLMALLAGCATPQMMQSQPQVNRAAKANKYAAPKAVASVEATTPNEIVKKRWYDRFRVHPKFFH